MDRIAIAKELLRAAKMFSAKNETISDKDHATLISDVEDLHGNVSNPPESIDVNNCKKIIRDIVKGLNKV